MYGVVLRHRFLCCLHDEVVLALGQLVGLAAVSEDLHREAKAGERCDGLNRPQAEADGVDRASECVLVERLIR